MFDMRCQKNWLQMSSGYECDVKKAKLASHIGGCAYIYIYTYIYIRYVSDM